MKREHVCGVWEGRGWGRRRTMARTRAIFPSLPPQRPHLSFCSLSRMASSSVLAPAASVPSRCVLGPSESESDESEDDEPLSLSLEEEEEEDARLLPFFLVSFFFFLSPATFFCLASESLSLEEEEDEEEEDAPSVLRISPGTLNLLATLLKAFSHHLSVQSYLVVTPTPSVSSFFFTVEWNVGQGA